MRLLNNKKAPLIAFIIRIFGFLIAVTAITLQLFTNNQIGKGFMANHVLAYFTIQTNIITCFIFLVLIIKTLVHLKRMHELKIASIKESIHLATVFYITITMTVYWLLLAPMLGVGDIPLAIFNTLFLHLFTPLIAIIDALLFMKHGKLDKKYSIKWLIYPALYLVLVIFIANVSTVPYYKFPFKGDTIPLMYPYPFLDPQIVGMGGFILVVFLLFGLCALYGLLYIVLDNKLAKLITKKRKNQLAS